MVWFGSVRNNANIALKPTPYSCLTPHYAQLVLVIEVYEYRYGIMIDWFFICPLFSKPSTPWQRERIPPRTSPVVFPIGGYAKRVRHAYDWATVRPYLKIPILSTPTLFAFEIWVHSIVQSTGCLDDNCSFGTESLSRVCLSIIAIDIFILTGSLVYVQCITSKLGTILTLEWVPAWTYFAATPEVPLVYTLVHTHDHAEKQGHSTLSHRPRIFLKALSPSAERNHCSFVLGSFLPFLPVDLYVQFPGWGVSRGAFTIRGWSVWAQRRLLRLKFKIMVRSTLLK